MLSFIIDLEKGLDPLLFGTSLSEATKLLGEPDEKQVINEDPNMDTIMLQYMAIGLSLFFENVNAPILSTIEVYNAEATLWGKAIFDMTEDKIIHLFAEHGHSVYESELHEWGEKRVSFDEVMVDLYFENGELNSFTFSTAEDTIEANFNFSLN